MNMNMDLLRKWLNLDREKKRLTDALEDVKKQLTEIDESVRKEFLDNEVQRIAVDGRTIYMACDRWPRAKNGDKAGLIAALKANNLGQFVSENFNTQSLRGLTNEMIRVYEANLPEDERAFMDVQNALPEGLRPYLEITETYTVKSHK